MWRPNYLENVAKKANAPILVTNRVGTSWGEKCEGGCCVYSKEGKLLGKWSAIGRSSYQNSRLFAGGAGIAMGNAMSKALGKLPWRAIALGRQKPPGK